MASFEVPSQVKKNAFRADPGPGVSHPDHRSAALRSATPLVYSAHIRVLCTHGSNDAESMEMRRMRLRVDTEGGREGAKPLSEAVMQKQEVELWRRAAEAVRRINAENPGLRYAELGQEIEEDEQGRPDEGSPRK